MKSKTLTIVFALLFTLAIPVIGYIYLGWLIAFLFLIGYFGGFILWLVIPTKASWASIKAPFLTTLAAFLLLHKVEENRFKFFEVVSDKITGIPVPEVTPLLIIGLLILPVGAWIATPFLIKRNHAIGYYLAWTFSSQWGLLSWHIFFFPFLPKSLMAIFLEWRVSLCLPHLHGGVCGGCHEKEAKSIDGP